MYKQDIVAKIMDEMYDTFIKKNNDYGDSAGDTYNKFGLISYIVRLNDKLNRVTNLYLSGEQEVKDESIEDTLLDMATYCIMAAADMRVEAEEDAAEVKDAATDDEPYDKEKYTFSYGEADEDDEEDIRSFKNFMENWSFLFEQ